MSAVEETKPLLQQYADAILETAPSSRSPLNAYLIFLVCTAVLGSFSFGWNIGVLNNPEAAIRDCDDVGDNWLPLCIKMDSILWGTVVGGFALGGLVGGLSGGFLCKTLGRKTSMFLNNILLIIGGILITLSTNVTMFAAGRFIIGIGAGIATAAIPMFISEISPNRYRGTLGALHQLATVIGILVAQFVGIPLSTQNTMRWRILLAISIVPPLLQLLLLPFAVETPRFLVSKGKREEAIRAFTRISKSPCAEHEVDLMIAMSEKESHNEALSIWRLLRSKQLRKTLILALVTQLAQQLSGVNGVISYSTSVFSLYFNSEWAKTITVGMGFVNLLVTIISVLLMDYAGRRALMLFSQFGIVIVSALVVFSQVFAWKWGAVIGLVGFIAVFAIGLGPIPWLIMPEIFPIHAIGAAASIGVALNWSANFLVTWLFPSLQTALGVWVFMPFCVISLLLALITFAILPETKGKSVDEITELLQ